MPHRIAQHGVVRIARVHTPIGDATTAQKLLDLSTGNLEKRSQKANTADHSVRTQTCQTRAIAASRQAKKEILQTIIRVVGQGDTIVLLAVCSPELQATPAGSLLETLSGTAILRNIERMLLV